MPITCYTSSMEPSFGRYQMSRVFSLTCVLTGMVVSLWGQSAPTRSGSPPTVVQVPSTSLNETRSVSILLPADYAKSARRYPVLYLLHGAAAVGMRGDVGVLAKGRLADIIAVRGNPLDDLRALQSVTLVMKGGTVVR